jgi:hypothetical protein
LDPKLDRATLEAVWQAIAHGKMINRISPSVAFVATFWLPLADLTLLTPV